MKTHNLEVYSLRDYELVMIFSPATGDEGVSSTLERLDKTIKDDGGSVNEREDWGLRKLSYPIQHFSEGNYVFTKLNMEATTATKIERNMTASQEVMRHLLLKLD